LASSSELELEADHHQVYLQDEQAAGDLDTVWSREAVARLLGASPGTVGIGTLRDGSVRVVVRVQATEPVLDLRTFDHVAECVLTMRSSRLVVAGCMDYRPTARRLEITPGKYRVRLQIRGAATVAADESSGQEIYEVVLWPSEDEAVVVHKLHKA